MPTRRGDITIFEDMLEEVARIYGYDHLPYTLPVGSSQAGGLTKQQQLKRDIAAYMQGVGLMETITYSLTKDALVHKLISPEISDQTIVPVQLAMPMSEDHKYLRLSILPELLESLAYNHARNQYDLAYYELGNIFISDEDTLTKQPTEQRRLAGALTGNWIEHPWQQEKKQVDFYLVKGIVEGLFAHVQIPVTFEQAKLPDMHPGRGATIKIDDKVVGFIGQVHPQLQKMMDLKETYVFDMNMEEVYAAYSSVPSYHDIPKYPSIARDIAFILDEEVVAGDVKAMIEKSGSPLVKDVQIFDVYQGDNLPEGKKSVAYSLLYQDPEKTLTDEEIEASYQEIIETINKQFNAYVRT